MLRFAAPNPPPGSMRLGVNGVNVPGDLGKEGETVCPGGADGRSGDCASAKVGASRQTTKTTLSVSRKEWFTVPRGNGACNGIFSLFRSRRVKEKARIFMVFARVALTPVESRPYDSPPRRGRPAAEGP